MSSGKLVVGVVRPGTRRAENAHRGLDLRQSLEAFDEFGHDLENLPGLAGEQPVVDQVQTGWRWRGGSSIVGILNWLWANDTIAACIGQPADFTGKRLCKLKNPRP